MSTFRSQLVINLVGKQQIASMLDEASGRMEKTAAKAGSIGDQAKASEDGIQSLGIEIKGTFNNLSSNITAVSTGFVALKGGIESIFSALKGVGQSLAAQAAFAASFDDAAAAMERFRSASLGVVDDRTLKQRANRARGFGLSIEQIEIALAAASRQSLATGESFDSTFDAITEGAKDLTDSFGEATGVFLDGDKILQDYAATVGVAAEDLSDLEKKSANTAAAFSALAQRNRELAGTFDDQALHISRAEATFNSYVDKVEQFFYRGVVYATDSDVMFGDIAADIAAATPKIELSAEAMAKARADGEALARALGGHLADALGISTAAVDDYAEAWRSFGEVAKLVEGEEKGAEKRKAKRSGSGEAARAAADELRREANERRRLLDLMLDEDQRAADDQLADQTHDLEVARLAEEAHNDALRIIYEARSEMAEEAAARQAEAQEELIRRMNEGFGNLEAAANDLGAEWSNAVQQSAKIYNIFAKSQGDLAKAVPGSLSAMGALTAGFIDNTAAQAAIQGAFEVAASVAAFARLDFLAGSMHAASAALYFAVAGTSGGGKGKGAGSGASGAGGGAAPTAGGLGGPQTPQGNGSGGGDVIVYVQGWVGSQGELRDHAAGQVSRSRLDGMGRAAL